MAKEQGEPQKEHAAPPGVDTLALATLAGVVAVLIVSFASWRDISRIDRRLGELEARMDQVDSRAPVSVPHRGPDPNLVYTVKTDGAPSRGHASAPVTIAEFSDFQ